MSGTGPHRRAGTYVVAPVPVRTLLPLLLLLLLATAAPAAAAERSVPRGWLGVIADGALTGGEAASFDSEFDGMVSAGVESVRTSFYWNEAQPEEGRAPDLSRYDAVVASAARRRLVVLPIVHRTPGWASRNPADLYSSPRDEAPYAAFLTALVGRYGPRGSFWSERPELPKVPIRDWQVWNEPDLTRYWAEQPFAKAYVRLTRAADAALKAADPGSRTILAGFPNESFNALAKVYAAGGRGTFDAVALHPYTGKPRNVVKLLELARRVMRRNGDGRMPVWITELSWPAAEGRVKGTRGFETTERGQASRLRDGLRRLAAARKRLRIERVFWYTWLSTNAGPNSFEYSGLRRLKAGRPVSARSLEEYRRAARRLEGCAKAAGDASRCR